MFLKQLNLGTPPATTHKDWAGETRFINYEYGPLHVQNSSLPQQPSEKFDGYQPLKRFPLKSLKAARVN